jgi:hypothetical protein
MSADTPIGGLLQGLVLNATVERYSTAITVTVDGMLLSGYLISPRQFYAGLQDLIAAEGDIGSTQLSLMLQRTLEQAPTIPDDAVISPDAVPELFYLRDAICWLGAHDPVLTRFWAGRYRSITGWAFGIPKNTPA